MGLFSRKKSEQNTRSASRTATSSEAQAAELRGRARRRLIGALVLVLTAIIVVPMMFDDTSTQQPDTPVVLPAMVPPVPEPDMAAVTQPSYSVDTPVLSSGADPEPAPGTAVAMAGESPQQPADPESHVDVSPTPEAPVEATPPVQEQNDSPPSKPEPKAAPPAQSQTAPAADTRTDDGSVALALLEGRTPAQASSSSGSSAQQQGTFILQIAAYSTQADAESRRSSLVSSGVTNAYVERAMSNDKATYRLRVGSFPTRDAAQAAQARLRALGYDNSMLLTQ